MHTQSDDRRSAGAMPPFVVDARIAGRMHRRVDLDAAADGRLAELPVIHRILLENVIRCAGADADLARRALLDHRQASGAKTEIPFSPGRILMHDTTCGPALVDIAAMRSAIAEAGGDPSRLMPRLPVDVSTDHSIAVDVFANANATAINTSREMERNKERYQLMKWASATLGIRVHPPGTGIMHTLNLERLATVVTSTEHDGAIWAVPDTLIGTDSHTPMINGIGVLGWGVGGIEAEAVMFGIPLTIRVPDVVGVRLVGGLGSGALATDLALTVSERLRRIDLADRYVEFFGPGVATLSAGDRAVVANMTPEFGANTGYFPIDAATIRYLRDTGRDAQQLRLIEEYARANGLWFDPDNTPSFSEIVEIDLDAIRPSLAGPRRPQDRIAAGATRAALGLDQTAASSTSPLPRAPVAIAAITSCTNTSDPRLLVAAGLLARKARLRGLAPPAWVKTSLAPGSPAAARYLARAELLADLEAIGFGIVGYGCTTCIGNSGPLAPAMADRTGGKDVNPVAVLSGNRNFPGRVHPGLELGFLASPPMVVAFALAGDADRNILVEPLATGANGREVFLRDLWPANDEIDAVLAHAVAQDDVAIASAEAEASAAWAALEAPTSALWPWDDASTYIRRPPFVAVPASTGATAIDAVPLLVLGDDMTTDHISPAGQIPRTSPAARHLVERGVAERDINVYAAYRGNWEVMLRGLFTNTSARNQLAPNVPIGATVDARTGSVVLLTEAAAANAREGRASVIVAGERYGMGSSRDWAAKGAALLGVRAVIAKSFERIHRTNLIGMGILPVVLPSMDGATLDLTAASEIHIETTGIGPRSSVSLRITSPSTATSTEVSGIAAIETDAECATWNAGGFIPQILASLLA